MTDLPCICGSIHIPGEMVYHPIVTGDAMTEPSADPAQPHPCPACDQLVTDGRLYCPDHRAVRRPSTGTTQRDQQEKAP